MKNSYVKFFYLHFLNNLLCYLSFLFYSQKFQSSESWGHAAQGITQTYYFIEFFNIYTIVQSLGSGAMFHHPAFMHILKYFCFGRDTNETFFRYSRFN